MHTVVQICTPQKMIDWDDLRYFLAVVQSGSYQAASKKLGVDRTTVSRRVDALEKSVGAKLFTQIDKEYHQTEAGRAVLDVAQRLDEQVRLLSAQLKRPEGSLEGLVRLAVSSSFGDVFIAEIMAFHHLHPLVNIEVSNVSDPMNAVISRKADLGICVAYDQPSRLDCEFVGSLEVAVYKAAGLPDDHPSAQAWVGWSEDIPKSFAAWMNEYAPENARISTRVNSWESLKSAVLSGAGIAPLWCLLAEREPGLSRVSEKAPGHYIGLWLTSLDGLKRDASQQALWRFLLQRIRQMLV
ncbi:LysR family transcriptional regulator [Paraburkholderia sp. D15]|uniref:LysR family transcriptional regulator n=1 Tax=Paraburkholderia sp. D15 TaxID=2880218 RepID=UPI002478CDA0|nr:LysR family transcriptional regulator [Paraburkholderia sp. D15]WGS54157.1 LysR family transcriptional regulator [Paraburkholderia sp. D15]